MRPRMLLAAILLLAWGLGLPIAGQPPADDQLQPVPFNHVRFTDGFWAEKAEVNRAVTIPFILGKNEETGRVDNFAIAGKLKAGAYRGQRYNDTDVYKSIEGASYSLAVHPDEALDARLDALIRIVASAQEPDGYLFTARTADPDHPQPGIGASRWVEETVSHELYNAGHLYEAAVAHFQATGKRTLLDVALKNADLVAGVFGPDKRHGFPGHQEIEIGLVKLYRVTGRKAYLDLATYFLEARGRDVRLTQYPPGSRFAIYNDPVQIQAHLPVLEQEEAVGHAVRATYMYAGMADIAALGGPQAAAYAAAAARLWLDVVSKKLALTGGVGARHDRESFGAAYDLPNRTSYNETCAGIGNALWNHRMFLSTGDVRYLDVMERVIYNGVLAGVALDGKSFFYANPLESDGKYRFNQGSLTRAPYFDVACCPGNISRFLPSIAGLFYAVKGTDVFVNLYGSSEARIDVGGRRVTLRQQTNYPWDGNVILRVEVAAPMAFALRLREPSWARGQPAPGGLYRYADTVVPYTFLQVNGQPVRATIGGGWTVINRTWKSGDTVELGLPMLVRRVAASDLVAEDRGKVAIERGPLVYCVEGVDNGGHALDVALADTAPLKAEFRPDMLNGVVVITGPGGVGSGGRALTAIPYFAWANRGPGEMAVWLRRAQ